MEPEEPKRLDYASPDVPKSQDEGVRRYYREPPEFEEFAATGFIIVAVAGIAAVVVVLWLWILT